MKTKLTLAELAVSSERDLGASSWLRIEQSRIDDFAAATDDRQWIHIDSQRAADGPFGGTIAHGYLTLSLIPILLRDLIRVTDAETGVNYGLDGVRFTSPVRVDDRVRLRATIIEAEIRPGGAVRYRLRVSMEIEHGSRPAMIGEAIFLRYPGAVPQV